MESSHSPQKDSSHKDLSHKESGHHGHRRHRRKRKRFVADQVDKDDGPSLLQILLIILFAMGLLILSIKVIFFT